MAFSTSGWTVVVSTSQAAPNSQSLSTRCFAGIGTRRNAMCTSWMFQLINAPGLRRLYGNLLLRKVAGSLEAGHSKNSLLPDQLNSSPETASDSVIRLH